MTEIETLIAEGIETEIADEAQELTRREARKGGAVKKQPKDDERTLPALVAAAERSIEAVEQLPLGEPFDAAVTGARIAIDAARQRAERELFPGLAPATEIDLRDLDLGMRAWPAIGPVTTAALDLHGEALAAGRQGLAELIRSSRVRKIIAARARETRSGDAARATAIEQKHVGLFMSGCARQLHERQLAEPASGFLTDALPQLVADFATTERRHVEHAAHVAEQQRIEAEAEQQRQREAAEAVERAAWTEVVRAERLADDPSTYERRLHLAGWYAGAYGAYEFTVEGERLTGAECARRLKAGDDYGKYYRAQLTGQQPAGYRGFR